MKKSIGCGAATPMLWLLGYLAATGTAAGLPRVASTLLWLPVAILAARCAPSPDGWGPGRGGPVAALGGALFFALYLLLGGLVGGLGRSPYLFAPRAIAVDLVLLGLSAAGQVALVYTLVALSVARGRPGLGVAASGLALGSYALTPARLDTLLQGGGVVETVSVLGVAAGVAASGLLVALLVLLGRGPAPGFAYAVAVGAAERLSPVLPDLAWYGDLFVRLLLATGMYVLLVSTEGPWGAPGEPRLRGDLRVPRGLAPLAAAAVTIWLSHGLLGFYLYAVTSSSMVPAYGVGDLLVVAKPRGDIAVGDIVVYRNPDGVMVAHRVVAKQHTGGEELLVTKGDAVPRPDPEPVPPAAVAGVVKAVLPKLGWPSILAHRVAAWILSTLHGQPSVEGDGNSTQPMELPEPPRVYASSG